MSTVPPPLHRILRELLPQIRLSPRDRQVLLTIDETERSTTVTIAASHFLGNRSYAKDRLGTLSRHGLVRRLGRHWVLGALGQEVVPLIRGSEAESGSAP